MSTFILLSAADVARLLADRVRALRLQQGWTQAEAAERAAMSLASYKRFERSGAIPLAALLRVAVALGRLSDFEAILAAPALRSLDEALAATPPRKRAPRRGKP